MSRSPVTYELLYKTSRRHKRILRFITFLLLVAMACFLLFVYKLLKEYESVQPKYCAQTCLERLNEGEYDLLVLDEKIIALGQTEDYLDALRSKLDGQTLTMKEDASAPRGKQYYTLFLNKSRFGRLILRENETPSAHGFTRWLPDSVEVNDSVVDLQKFTVRALESSQVYADGTLLTADSLIESGIEADIQKHLPEEAYSFRECVYEISTFSRVPEICVTDKNGIDQKVDRQDSAFIAQINYDTEIDPEKSQRAELVLTMMADFTIGETSISRVLNYVEPNSNAYSILYEYSKWKSATASHGHMENLESVYYLTTGDHSFACRLKGDFYCGYGKRDDTVYNLDYTMYFRLVNNAWLMYDFSNTSE